MIKRRHTPTVVFLLLLLLPIALFSVKLRYDNKYASAGPQANRGSLPLSPRQLESTPLLFLRDGWEFYQYQFLTPSDFSKASPPPTTYLFLGQYGGFELNDSTASPHGVATYRLRITNNDPPPVYMLERPAIDSSHCIWANGQLLYSLGISNLPDVGTPAETALTFYGAEEIELIVAVEDHAGLYSGMHYPPAFGLPSAVAPLLHIRLLFASALAAIAILAAAICFYFRFSIFRNKPAGLFALLCVFFLCSMGQALPGTLCVSGSWLVHVQRFCYFGAMGCILYLQAEFSGLPRRWLGLVSSAGIAFCIWVVLFPLFFMGSHLPSMFFFSKTIGAYKWIGGISLLIGGVYAAMRNAPRRFLYGAYVYSCALLFDRIFPLYEPKLLFWPMQSATLFNVMLIFSGLVSESIRIFQTYLITLERERNLRQLDEVRKVQYQQLAQHMNAIRKMKHEMRGFLIRLNFYLQQQNYPMVEQQLQQQLGQLNKLTTYTSHALFDAILSYYVARADAVSIPMTIESIRLPKVLHMDDADLTGVLTNMLQNALEAAIQVPATEKRYIRIVLQRTGGYLNIQCSNRKSSPVLEHNGRIQTSKTSAPHGLGLEHIRQIVSQYHGLIEISHQENRFLIKLLLPILTEGSVEETN